MNFNIGDLVYAIYPYPARIKKIGIIVSINSAARYPILTQYDDGIAAWREYEIKKI